MGDLFIDGLDDGSDIDGIFCNGWILIFGFIFGKVGIGGTVGGLFSVGLDGLDVDTCGLSFTGSIGGVGGFDTVGFLFNNDAAVLFIFIFLISSIIGFGILDGFDLGEFSFPYILFGNFCVSICCIGGKDSIEGKDSTIGGSCKDGNDNVVLLSFGGTTVGLFVGFFVGFLVVAVGSFVGFGIGGGSNVGLGRVVGSIAVTNGDKGNLKSTFSVGICKVGNLMVDLLKSG